MRAGVIVVLVCMLIAAVFSVARADDGLVADYTFSEGSGSLLKDSSGNGNDGKIQGAEWVKVENGYALKFDGDDDCVDCGDTPSLNLKDQLSLEVWMRAAAKPSDASGIVGKYYDNYALTYGREGGAWWYISSGSNGCFNLIEFDKWEHVVGTFDGKTLKLYADGVKIAESPTKIPSANPGKNFYIGKILANPDAPDPAYGVVRPFLGMIGGVKVYNRALSPDEVATHFRDGLKKFVDPTWFNRVRLIPYAYPDRGQIVVDVDYKGLLPLAGDSRVQVHLAKPGEPTVIKTAELSGLTRKGRAEASFDTTDLQPGTYEARAVFTDDRGARPGERVSFSYARSTVKLPSPDTRFAPLLPASPKPAKYKFDLSTGGGFSLNIDGTKYPVESSYSYPNGGENRLGVGAGKDGESSWKISTKRLDASHYKVVAKGAYYTIERNIRLLPDRVSVKDKITNNTPEDIGIILSNHIGLPGQAFSDSYLSGYKGGGMQEETLCPSVFVGRKGLGVGILPLDDVYIIQSQVFNRDGRIGVGSNKFGLAAKASYMLEWAIYPNSTGDYYDFINAVRRDEGRNGVTVEGQWACWPQGPFDKSMKLPSDEFFENGNIKYFGPGSFAQLPDDPELSLEGIDFVNYPKAIQFNRELADKTMKAHPGVECFFHIAHSLYATNKPSETFPDSRVIDKVGNQAAWPENPPWISQRRLDEGWNAYTYYPTPGNSFHNALMKSVDVYMDECGYNCFFMDGFMVGYMGKYTYDRWDNHSVEIDPATKTIKRKMGSVLLLSQPSLVQFVEKAQAKGATVIANNSVITRTIGKQKIIHDREVVANPDTHLAPTSISLSNMYIIQNDADIYRDALDKLKWGELMFVYATGDDILKYPSLAQQMFPITFEEIHSGCVKGRERIVTMNSGVYGWPGDNSLHFCYKYDPRGVSVIPDFVTTVDGKGVRTLVSLGDQESAVVKKIPVYMKANGRVNVSCPQYDDKGIKIQLNGKGKVDVTVKAGDFSVKPKAEYTLTVDGHAKRVTAGAGGSISFRLDLNGVHGVSLTRP